VDWFQQHLGLTALTVLSTLIVVYLAYVMLHPDRF